MKKGFTLIEVLIALCILMFCIAAFIKLNIVGIYFKAYGERLTRSTILGNSKLSSLRSLPLTTSDLQRGWHQDPDNPLKGGGSDFYRFWSVTENSEGKDVRLFVSWKERGNTKDINFSSYESFKSSSCHSIELRELFLNLKQ